MSDHPEKGPHPGSEEPLAGTVKYHRRHLFVCTEERDWPARIETGGGLLQALSETLAAPAEGHSLAVKLTACQQGSGDRAGDLLLFPEQLRYRGVEEADLPALAEHLRRGNGTGASFHPLPLPGTHIFVCVHDRRDPRCGRCGPPLLEAFQEELPRHGLHNVTLRPTSHVGGHRFAANVIIYPGGDWYGRVLPRHVPELIDRHLKEGQILAHLWRGRLGLDPEQQRACLQE